MKELLSIVMFSIILFLVSCKDSKSKTQQVKTITETTQKKISDSLTYKWQTYEFLKTNCEVSEIEDCKFYNNKYIRITNPNYYFINDSISKILIGEDENMNIEAERLYTEYEAAAADEPNHTLMWQFDSKMEVNYNKNGIFSFQTFDYIYMGGAHGMYASIGTNIDLKTKQILTFYDLVNESDSTELKKLGEKYFREAMEIDATIAFRESDYFWGDDFYLSDNFNINEEGITIIYLPYEIAAYAYGMPAFTIPFDELKSYFIENSPLEKIIE